MTVTRTSVLRLARERWGNKAELQEDRRAPSPEQRKETAAKCLPLRARIEELKAKILETERRGVRYVPANLLPTCEAFLAEPDKYRAAFESEVARAREYRNACDEQNRVYKELTDLQAGQHRTRYRISVVSMMGGGFGLNCIEAQADTLAELAEKIKTRK